MSNFLNLFNQLHDCKFNFSDTTNECTDKVNYRHFYLFNLIPAMVITLLFGLTKKRRSVLPAILNGRPGVVYAMNSLTRHSKMSYACAFGAAAHVVHVIVINGDSIIEYNGHRAGKAFINIIATFLYGMTFLPVFVSLTMGSIFGYGVGSLYVWMLTAIEIFRLAQCETNFEGRVLLVFRNLPPLLCLLYLSISLPLRFVRFVRNHRPWFEWTNEPSEVLENLDEIRKSYDGSYVGGILSKPVSKTVRVPEGRKEMIKANFIRLIKKYIYKRKRGYQYPSRLLSVLLVTSVVIYTIAYQVMALLVQLLRKTEECIPIAFYFWEDIINPFLKTIEVFRVSVILATTTALVLFIFSACGLLTSYRTHALEMYKGNSVKIHLSVESSPVKDCVNYIKYGGFQAAYMIWAFMIQWLVFFLVFFLVGILIKFFDVNLIKEFVNWTWPYLLTFVVINITIWLLSAFFFLQDRGEHLALDNRGWFFNCVYFFTFYFLFLGLFSCVLRMLTSMVLGLVYLGRLDKTILVKNFEVLDIGFNTYVGFMKTDCAHTHPVAIVFTRLMLLAARRPEAEPSNDNYEEIREAGGVLRHGPDD
ncbi:stimulated by retinoic acid gene 6 protein-like [Pomacea canaliculata]|uniref:stimulated by retinoic acid gene 6 protein-like n=1 Tax=Pomacea canaliculata TaxID=400727 RepID=UPI000D729281|nr:stimulated by retinoic acid gene 6 protein-like [Pomacea canaliculata]